MKVLSENKKAYLNYQILEKFEAGISLIGQEVKSIKMGRGNLAGSYVVLKDEEAYPRTKKISVGVYLIGANIPPYQPKNAPSDYQPERSRKLLLKKIEIKHLIGKVKEKGLTLVPLKMYTKKGKIKLEFATAKGRKKADKRELIKKREVGREIQQALRRNIS